MKQVTVPDPSLIADAHLRQILQALLQNQAVLFSASSASSTTTTEISTASGGAKMPIKAAGSLSVSALAVSPSLPADSTAGSAASISTLANACKAAILQQATQYNQLRTDVVTLAAAVKVLQAQQNELIKRVNKNA